MLLIVSSCSIILLIFGCDGFHWNDILEFEHKFRDFSVTADNVVATMEELVEKTTASTVQYLFDIDATSYLRPENSLKHDCWQVYKQLNPLLQSLKVDLVRIETPLVKRKLEIKERISDILTSIEIYKKLADNKYQTCLMSSTNCRDETVVWVRKKVASLRCRVMTPCGKEAAEHNVTRRSLFKRSVCGKLEFKCADDGRCIPASNVCNGENNCNDGSDEVEGCDRHCFNGFHCTNLKCVNKSEICNGEDDCGDSSDEAGCPPALYSAGNCSVETGGYLCSNRHCVALAGACDGRDDCGDGSDEGGLCGAAPRCPEGCSAGGGVCFAGPRGALCLTRCPQGTSEGGGLCLPGPQPPAATLAQLLEGVPSLLDRYSAANGYLKRQVIAGLHSALEQCQLPQKIVSLTPSTNQTAVV